MDSWIIILAIFVFYVVLRLFLINRKFSKSVEKELFKIVNSDEHKVRGRFE